jgi:geranylgeranyl pyrophosphate synthase
MIAYEHHARQDTSYWLTPHGKQLLASIIGIEFMHCYTLVHDDLPCMDNDELRRGKPTVWKMYWESMALLVWDTLQTMSFELLSLSGDSRVVTELARALWDLWVARWQARDTFLRHDALSLDELLRIHDEKTGIFIVASLMIGTLLAWWDSASQDQMRKLWILLGRAFQIQDDILDADWDTDTVWKKTQKDILLGKWIVSLLWLTKSRTLLNQIAQDIQRIIDIIDNSRLVDIAYYMIERQN